MNLVESENYYRMLVEMAPDVIYAISVPDGRFLSLSPMFEQITGWSVEEWLGRPFADIIHPDDLPIALAAYRQELRGEMPEPHEVRVRSSAGTYLDAELRGMPRTVDGEIVGVVGVARDISARRQVERELERSRDQLSAILQTVNDGISVQGRDGRLIYANEAAARLCGFPSVAAFLSADVSDILDKFRVFDEHGNPFPLDKLPGRRALGGEAAPEAVLRFAGRDVSEERWSLVKSTPVYDNGGDVAFAVSVFHDITDQRRAEAGLQQLAAIVQSSEDAIIGKALDTTITSWNPGAERLYGYSADEAVGQSITMLVPPDYPNDVPDIMARIRRGERISVYETVRQTKDGRKLDVSISISPIRDGTGAITGAATIARNITERKAAERERTDLLRREREARAHSEMMQRRLRFLAEASAILGSSLDYETTLGNVARLAVPYIGDWCTIDVVEEAGPLRRIAVTHPDPEKVKLAQELERRYPTDPQSGDLFTRVLKEGKPQFIPTITDEMVAAGARDPEHLMLLRGLGLRSLMMVPMIARERVLGVLAFVSSDSSRHYGQDDVALAEDLARRAAIAVDNARLYSQATAALLLREDFLSIASHELRTPLTALQLQVQVLQRALRSGKRNEEVSERVPRILDGVSRQIRRLVKLTSDLLDVSRIGVGRFELDLQEVDLVDIVREVIERFSEEAALTGSSLSLDAPSRIDAHADPDRLDQVVTNLVSNALKYGTGRPVDVTVSANGANASIAVRDRGIGIAPEQAGRVFDRFERVALSKNYGGLGLGLYIANQIVQEHGGTIMVQSELGQGSTFVVDIPLRHSPDTPA